LELENVEIRRFMIRHTNKDVHLAYLNIDKEAEKVARKHASEWIQSCLWMECYSTPVDTPVLDSSGVDSSRH
jgi:hypothetical protein